SHVDYQRETGDHLLPKPRSASYGRMRALREPTRDMHRYERFVARDPNLHRDGVRYRTFRPPRPENAGRHTYGSQRRRYTQMPQTSLLTGDETHSRIAYRPE